MFVQVLPQGVIGKLPAQSQQAQTAGAVAAQLTEELVSMQLSQQTHSSPFCFPCVQNRVPLAARVDLRHRIKPKSCSLQTVGNLYGERLTMGIGDGDNKK